MPCRHIAQHELKSITYVSNKTLAAGRVHGHCRHVAIMPSLFSDAYKKGGAKAAKA
jgi:hypothetical protein